MGHDDGPGRRVLSGPGGGAADVLAALPGADLTTVQLEVARRRAARLAGPDVLRRHRTDRFAVPSPLPFALLRRVEDAVLGAAAGFDLVALSPLVPLGTHSAVAGVAQHRVVPTGRGTEVAADPTTGLALEAAVRRSAEDVVRLASVQRVVRAQRVPAGMFAHFSLFGAVTAGRDSGDLAFERQHLAEHAGLLAAACRALGASAVELAVTVLDPRFEGLLDAVPDVPVRPFPERESGRGGYYAGLCFKVYASFGGGELAEVGDGGFTSWTRKLLGNAKERFLTSALGVDRLATLL
ncbi:hypothetical protein ACWEVP_16915 [Amycolatopsis sp. NPDC003865]